MTKLIDKDIKTVTIRMLNMFKKKEGKDMSMMKIEMEYATKIKQSLSHRKDALDGINNRLNDGREEKKISELDHIAIEKQPK